MGRQKSDDGRQKFLKKLTDYCLLTTDKKGFTLIETVIVIVILSVLAAIVIIRNPFESIKLNSATRKVAEDIRYVQKLSISNQTRSGMEFNGTGYCVFQNITLRTAPCLPVNALAKSSGDPCSTDAIGNFIVNFTLPNCSNFSNATITPPLTNPVAFNSLGTPVNQWGTIIGSQTVTLTLSGVPNKTINIESGTGRVSY